MNTLASQEPKTILSWSKPIAHALEMRGINSRELFQRAGIPYQTAVDPTVRIEASKIAQLFELSVEATQDPSFGLNVATFVNPATLHALGYSLFSSITLHDFCQHLVRFFSVLSDNAIHSLEEKPDSYRLNIKVTNPDLCPETVDAWVASIVSFCRTIYRPDFNPLRVSLSRDKPGKNTENFLHFFKSPVEFSAKENALYFDKEAMFEPLPSACSELVRRNDEIVIEYLARISHEDIVRQLEAKIIKLLPSGQCSRKYAALELKISSRSLQHKLEQKNTSYSEVLDHVRHKLACQYVEQRNLSISEITYLLGFSDTSNFTRAFKRWTGLSPSSYSKTTSQKN